MSGIHKEAGGENKWIHSLCRWAVTRHLCLCSGDSWSCSWTGFLWVHGHSDLNSIRVLWNTCGHQKDSSLSTGDPEEQGYLTEGRRRWGQEMLVPLYRGGWHKSWILNDNWVKSWFRNLERVLHSLLRFCLSWENSGEEEGDCLPWYSRLYTSATKKNKKRNEGGKGRDFSTSWAGISPKPVRG